jgi:hypothetical protein
LEGAKTKRESESRKAGNRLAAFPAFLFSRLPVLRFLRLWGLFPLKSGEFSPVISLAKPSPRGFRARLWGD